MQRVLTSALRRTSPSPKNDKWPFLSFENREQIEYDHQVIVVSLVYVGSMLCKTFYLCIQWFSYSMSVTNYGAFVIKEIWRVLRVSVARLVCSQLVFACSQFKSTLLDNLPSGGGVMKIWIGIVHYYCALSPAFSTHYHKWSWVQMAKTQKMNNTEKENFWICRFFKLNILNLSTSL